MSLALAPLSVHPDFQKMGVGRLLIKETFKIAKELGYESIFVLGSEKYYPRFGFEKSTNFGINAPFEVPSENYMAIELIKGALENVSGDIVYAKEFFEV
ncbi:MULTISPECIES: GNAT family N-acetyltransferase [unclassified Romboutsia]|uniref:GNAT family N-acetyltransferase n=1 Tax=unclassified Romboutsia TaxID=2626894 RepID=UPI0027BA8D95|nr:N-acetyltransferase [Romboutsia sp. 1001713B170207_170306_H8]